MTSLKLFSYKCISLNSVTYLSDIILLLVGLLQLLSVSHLPLDLALKLNEMLGLAGVIQVSLVLLRTDYAQSLERSDLDICRVVFYQSVHLCNILFLGFSRLSHRVVLHI